MDPFSIAAGVVGLAQALVELIKLAGELRDSIEKVSKNREKAKQLATNTYEIVGAIQGFYIKYSHLFGQNNDLQKRVADLYTSLTDIVKKCKGMLPKPEKHVLRKHLAGFRAWLKRGELEDRLVDLNAQAQECQMKFMTLSTLSTEVTIHKMYTMTTRMDDNISSIHQRVVVRRMTRDSLSPETSQPRHVDPVVAGSSVGILKSPDPHLSDSDVVEHAFLRRQVRKIDTLLSKLFQAPHMSFRIPPPRPDDPTHADLCSQLYISWEIVQERTALESAQLIDTIHNADSSTSSLGVSVALTHLGYRYEHLGMYHKALTLTALAIQLDRLAVEAYPDSDLLQRGLAINLENYAGLLLDCGKSTVEATRCMIEAVSIFRQLVAKLSHPGRKVDLADTLAKSSRLARHTGDPETAEAHSVEALEIILNITGTPPETIPDADTLRSRVQGWAAAERNGVLIVRKWREQAALICASVLKERFHCALARKSFSDAYKYAMASRNVYRIIANRHPQSKLVTLRDITTELLEEWADPLRSRTDTITLHTNAISYISATPSRRGDSDEDSLFRKYTLQAKLAIHLSRTNDDSAALEAQETAALYWNQYYSTYREMARKRLASAPQVVLTLVRQIGLHYGSRLLQLPPSTPLVVVSTAAISKRPALRILDQTDQSLASQAGTMERWFCDAYSAGPSTEPSGLNTPELLRYSHCNGVMAFCFARLGKFDAAHEAARRAMDTSNRVVDPPPPSTRDGGKAWWNMVAWAVNGAAWVSYACVTAPDEPRLLACAQDVVAFVESLFPSPEPICVPAGVDREPVLTIIGSVLAFYCRHLETLRRMDESLSISKSNFVWYTTRAPSGYPINRDYRHIAFVLDLARNLIYAGQWSTALTYTTTIFDALVSNPNIPLPSLRVHQNNICWSIFAILTHCSILTELGRVDVAAQCISQGMEMLQVADSDDITMWKRPALARKAMISALLHEDFADEMKHLGNCKAYDLRGAYARKVAYYVLAPSRIHSGTYLDASCILADTGDHKQAIAHAQESLSSIAILTTGIFNEWQDVAFMQQRTESAIALAVAFILGGHIQDAAELFPPLFDIYKKELQYQRNLYPGYAVALRLAGWVFDKLGNVAEVRRMKRQEAGLEYLLDEEADEETLRVIRIRVEMEERRPAIRRVREILGVEPYQAQPAE